MLTLSNFEQQTSAAILQRGKKYYNDGCVKYLEDTGDNNWCAEVEGADIYNVEINLGSNNAIESFSCDCPYDEDICKHVVATLYTLQKAVLTIEVKTTKAGKKKDVFETLLNTVSAKEFATFIRNYAAKNKNFKTEFELFFADKDSRVNVEEKYHQLVKKIIQKNTSRGYIDYRASIALSKEVTKLIRTGDEYIQKNNFKDAFLLAKAILKPVAETLENCDDSNGSIGGCLEDIAELFHKFTVLENVAPDMKELIFDFLEKELSNKLYFDYGDFGNHLFSVFKVLATQLMKTTAFIQFVDAQIAALSTGYNGNYQREYFQKAKIAFMQQTGKGEEAEKLVQQNMDIVEVRQTVVNDHIKKNEFITAKKIIAEGIKIAEQKQHTGTVYEWQKELLRIAVIEKDVATIRKLTKYFAVDRNFDVDYYNQWKATYSAGEWSNLIEDHITYVIEKVTLDWQKNKHRMWQPTQYPPLLHYVSPIYIQEKYWNRLLTLVQQENNLGATLTYHKYLYTIYPTELLAIYLPALEEYGINSDGRSAYKDLVQKMKKIMKDIPQGTEQILEIAKRLKEKFGYKPRRPAMIEELNKILK